MHLLWIYFICHCFSLHKIRHPTHGNKVETLLYWNRKKIKFLKLETCMQSLLCVVAFMKIWCILMNFGLNPRRLSSNWNLVKKNTLKASLMDFFINFSDQGLLGLKLKQSSWNVCRFQKRTFETNPNAKHWGLKCNIKSLCVTISNFSSKITREVSKCKTNIVPYNYKFYFYNVRCLFPLFSTACTLVIGV